MAVTKPRLQGDKTAFVTTASTSPVVLFSVPLVSGQVTKLRVQTVCKELVDTGKAVFERIGMFYTDGVQSYVQGPTWHMPSTIKNKPGFDLIYELTSSEVRIKVKNAAALNTKWLGRLQLDVI